MDGFFLATMVTTTSYGTWLPGDARGYVDDGQILPPDPKRWTQARALLAQAPVHFTPDQQDCLFESLRTAAVEFSYRLTDVCVESWHLHWIIVHEFDPVQVMVGRLKTRMRQALNAGRIWTAGYCHRPLNQRSLEDAQAYIARHPGCRMTDGVLAGRRFPGAAPG
jgi:REP element-mobilizing transposase RayT